MNLLDSSKRIAEGKSVYKPPSFDRDGASSHERFRDPLSATRSDECTLSVDPTEFMPIRNHQDHNQKPKTMKKKRFMNRE